MLDGVGTPIGTMQSLCSVGHSTPEITREIYSHAILEEQRRAVECVERLVLGPKFGFRRSSIKRNSLRIKKYLVGAWRFELQTSCAQGRRATRLRYAPT